MTFLLAITTFNRVEYLKKLIDSFLITAGNHKYIVAINDDGSKDGSREYLKSLQNTKNIKWEIFYSNNKGSYFCANTLFNFALSQEFDLGFSLDDDLFFIRKGWDELYYNAYKKSGHSHLSHYSIGWSGERKTPIINGSLQSFTTALNSQGAFYTFTKDLLKEIGYLDTKSFGKRGEGHRDWSLRACRVGANNDLTFWDAKDSKKYIQLHPKKGYLLTPNYDEELKIAKANSLYKKKVLKNTKRKFIDLEISVINHYFDKVYLINLKRRPDRLAKMKSLLTKLKINYQLVEAVDGLDLKVSNAAIVGCHLSHLKIFEDVKKNGYERPLILEDDLISHKDFDRIIQNIFKIPEDWRMMYLGSSDWNWKNNKENYNPENPFYRGFNVDSTFAYSFKREILYDLINIFSKPVTKPCDTSLHLIHKMFPTYILYPHLFIADVSDSDIRGERKMNEHSKKVNWRIKDYDCDFHNNPQPKRSV